MKRLFLVAVLVLVIATPQSAFAWERNPGTTKDRVWSAEVYGWQNSLIGNGTVKGMVLDFKSEADFTSKTNFGGTVCFPLTKRTNVTLTYNSFDNSGNVTKALKFDNNNYKLGANVKIQNTWVDLTGSYLLSRYEKGYWDFLYGVKINNSKLDITGYNTTTSAFQTGSWSQNFPIPYIGVGGGVKMSDNVWFDGHIKYISVNKSGADVRSYDIDMNLAFQLNAKHAKKDGPEWFATLGMRKFNISGSFDNDSVEMGYSGPTFGFTGRF